MLDFVTVTLRRAVPPAEKNNAASLASALVRVQGEQITDEDLARIGAKFGESWGLLIEAAKAEVLDLVPAVDAKGDGEAYRLRGPVAAAEAGSAAAAEPEVAAEAAEEVAEAAPKPAKKRSTRPGRGSRRKKAEVAEAAEAPVELAAPEPAAPVDPEPEVAVAAETAPVAEVEPAAEPVAEKKPRRRRTRKKAAEPAPEQVAELAPAAEPVEESREEALLADGASVAEAVEVPESVAAVEPVAAEAVEPEAAPAPEPEVRAPHVRHGRGRRGGGKPAAAESLSSVPYVRRGGDAEAAAREEIVKLDQRLWMNGWLLSHPGAFTLYERELRGIDAELRNGDLPGDLTRRQLAYKMGGNEKFFEYGSDGFKLLRAMGADDLIRHRPMPKADLMYHVPRRRKNMRILVTENLDPWLDVRDLMYEDGRSLILGERVHGVVLGGGNPVIEDGRLTSLLEALGADAVEVLYWGDIDRAGLSLLQRLQALLDGQYKVVPFMPAYRKMLELAMERYPDAAENESTTQGRVEVDDYSEILSQLNENEAGYFSAVIEGARLVPQEILTKKDL